MWQVVFFGLCLYSPLTKKITFWDLLNFMSLFGILIALMQAYILRFRIEVLVSRVVFFFQTKWIFDLHIKFFLLLS